MDIKYPNITAKLIGEDGNVFNLLGICNKALRNGGVDKDERDAFLREVMACSDYTAALGVMQRWVTVE